MIAGNKSRNRIFKRKASSLTRTKKKKNKDRGRLRNIKKGYWNKK